MKKLFVILSMMLLTASTFAYDFSAVCESGQTLYYSYVSDSEVKVVYPSTTWNGYTQPTGHLIIPETVDNEGVVYTVISIGYHAFYYCTDLTSVEIPNTIISIQTAAFEKTGLTSVEIPNSVTLIQAWAFARCTDLLSLTIGSSVSTIETGAFSLCTGLQTIHCNAHTPPAFAHAGNNSYFNNEIFESVPTDIPVYVSCLAYDRFETNEQWDQFSNLQGVFIGVPNLNVSVNVSGLGIVETISIPESCDNPTATVLAIPNPGHEFSYWKNGIEMVSFSPEYTFVLDQNTTLVACFDSAPIIYDSIAFPDHVVGRIINDSGQVTNEYLSDFIYEENGEMIQFKLPSFGVETTYTFEDYPTMPNRVHTYYDSGHPQYYDESNYTYENNRLMHVETYSGLEEIMSYYDYYYDESWRLTKIEQTVIEFDEVYYWRLHFYEYENNYRTRIDVDYYTYDSVNFICLNKTTKQYNERHQLLSSRTDTYNSAGDTTSIKLQTYSYTPNNKIDHIITQKLTNGEWLNSGIVQYVYDDKGRVVEYQTGSWSTENQDWNITKKTIYDFNDAEQKLTVSFRKKNSNEWIWDTYSGQDIFYEADLKLWNQALLNYNPINQFEMDLHYVVKEKEEGFPSQSEWYYEIAWDNGDIAYQHLEYTADTTIGTSQPKVIVRSNTHYDRDTITDVTHEYILENGHKVYWWNKELEEFTLLYDYDAEPGDEWEIKVGLESITVHVDNVDVFVYEGESHKRLYISDASDIFNGEIIVGFGHMTSFFPEKLMNRDKGFRVNGLRCYWVGDALLYHDGEEDCDAIHSELQNLDEPIDNAVFLVYPNPANDILIVETRHDTSLPDPTCRITNLMGQTVLSGNITAEPQQINIESLPAGMYFITFAGETLKFVVK